MMHFEDNLDSRIWELKSDIASKYELLDSLVGTLYPPLVAKEISVLNKELSALERIISDNK